MIALFAVSAIAAIPIYKDSTRPLGDRVKDLLDQMTLEEKIGQMCVIDGRADLENQFKNQQPGAVIYALGKNASKAMDLEHDTRLKIPLLVGNPAIHGVSFWPGATIFPTQLALASSWNEDLIKMVANVTAYELKNTGSSWTFSPVFCIARDTRWGRVGETFGEDPHLISVFGNAMVKGYQDSDIMATAKHFVAYSETSGGRDSSEAEFSRRKLKSFFLDAFEKAVKEAKVGSVMTASEALDGTPCTTNEWLVKNTLRGDWNFSGLVITDWDAVGQLISTQKVAANMQEAAIMTVKAGVDMVVMTPEFYQAAIDAVNAGKLDVKLIDEAVTRILTTKFSLGLFENERYPDESKVQAGTEENRAWALKAAEESLVLLKNDKTLPVSKSLKTIAVLGPNADHPIAQLGDWSLGSGQINDYEHPRESTITVLDGIKARFPDAEVIYEKGAGIEPGETADLNAALAAAEKADLVIVVIGDRPMYWGEKKSTATLEFMGTQNDLLNAVVGLGKKVVIDIIASKPLVLSKDIISKTNAIIHQFSPGMLGGQAFARAIAGDFNPSGRLTISIPEHVGQLPVYYNQIKGQHGDVYADLTEKPQYAFGHGHSYSTFKITNVKLDKTTYTKTDTITVTMTVNNKGPYDGADVIQIYISDKVTSCTWTVQELKAFKKVEVKNGEKLDVTITLNASDCSLVNANGVRIVESGAFELRVAHASDSIVSRQAFTIE